MQARSEQQFLGLRFFSGSLAELRSEIRRRAQDCSYTYMITPNADIVARAFDGDIPREIIDSADLLVCDSRVLALLARSAGKKLMCFPGSDLMRDLLEDGSISDLVIGVFGPSQEDFVRLQNLYPDRKFHFINAPRNLLIGSDEWQTSVSNCVSAPWDLLWACISSPKGERLIYDIANHGRRRGLAMGAGAGVDFLTGRQRRAPTVFQRLTLEWLFRLLSSPSRMWRRYLINSPKVLKYHIELELMPRLSGFFNSWTKQ